MKIELWDQRHFVCWLHCNAQTTDAWEEGVWRGASQTSERLNYRRGIESLLWDCVGSSGVWSGCQLMLFEFSKLFPATKHTHHRHKGRISITSLQCAYQGRCGSERTYLVILAV